MPTHLIWLAIICLGLAGAGGAVYTVQAAPISPRPARLHTLRYLCLGIMIIAVCAAVIATVTHTLP